MGCHNPVLRKLRAEFDKETKEYQARYDQDPADLPQRVAKYQAWLAQKRAGRLPAYVVVGREGR